MRATLARWVARHLIADDPHPDDLTTLDKLERGSSTGRTPR